MELGIKFKFAPNSDPAIEVGCLGCGRPWEVKRSQLQDTTDLVCPSCGGVHPLTRHEVLQAMQELLDVFWGKPTDKVSGHESAEAHGSRS